MATLIQSSTSDTLYFGWYGINQEGCTPFTLLEQESGFMPPPAGWRHKIFPESTAAPPSSTNGFTIGKSSFFRAIKEVNNLSGGLTAYDGTSTSPFGLAGSQIKELVCGRCYFITLQPGDKQLEIPEFHFANQATSDYFKLIANE